MDQLWLWFCCAFPKSKYALCLRFLFLKQEPFDIVDEHPLLFNGQYPSNLYFSRVSESLSIGIRKGHQQLFESLQLPSYG